MSAIECRSEWDIVYVGVLTPEMVFKKIDDYRKHSKILSVFVGDINFHSHKTLLFKEKYIPFIYGLTGEIDCFIGKRVQIITQKGTGTVSLTTDTADNEEINYPFSSPYVLCSNTEGMDFLKKKGIERIALRGEFIYNNASKENYRLLEDTLKHGVKLFDEVMFRFTDINSKLIIGERGTSLLLNAKKELLHDELNCVVNTCKENPNLSVLCPFVRTEDEAIEIHRHIRNLYSGKIGCMIEVPLLIYEGKRITHLFDFFVVGISDLFQLLQGADRNLYAIHYNTISFIAELLDTYFFPYLNRDKNMYITSKLLFDLLKSKSDAPNILLLSK